jgi:hypothetical protein
VSVSGYPLDVSQRYPAAAAGQLSRENNDGMLQLAVIVNSGNSGGPAIDASGQLLGVVTARGLVEEGAQGVALIEPLRFVIPAHAAALEALRASPTASRAGAAFARVVATLARPSEEWPVFEQASVPAIREAAAAALDPDLALIVAAHAWNTYIALLEARQERDPSELGPEDRELAEELAQVAVRLARRALERAPYLIRDYPIARSIVNSGGRAYVPSGGTFDLRDPEIAACDEPLARWRLERDKSKKAILFRDLPPLCRRLVTASPP